MLSEGEVKVSSLVTLKHVALVKSLGYNLLSVSQLLDEGYVVCFKLGASRVLNSRGDLVCTIVPEGQIFHTNFFQSFGPRGAWLLVLLPSCGDGIGGWGT